MDDLTITAATWDYCHKVLTNQKAWSVPNKYYNPSKTELKRQQAYYNGMRDMYEAIITQGWTAAIPPEGYYKG